MHEVKRVAAVIKPTQVMLDWLKDKPGNNQDLNLDTVQRDCTVLLLPAFEGPAQAKGFIKDIYNGIFESEMASWGLDETTWPRDRSYKMFNEWFKVELHSVLFDLGDIDAPVT